MTGDIGQRFLNDAVYGLLEFKRKTLLIINVHVRLDIGATFPFEYILAQGGCQSLLFQSNRVHFLDEEGQFLDHLVNQVLSLNEMVSGGLGILLQDPIGSSQLGQGSESLLLGAVMQLARQSVTLLNNGQFLGSFEEFLD